MDRRYEEDLVFLFGIQPTNPELSEGANISLQIGAIATRQTQNERTRCIHQDGRPENVAEHSFMLAKVAPELAVLLYPELDENLVARLSTLHDDLEAYVGDTPTDSLSDLDLTPKEILEVHALRQLSKEYAHIPSYVRLVQVYEAQQVPEARFVRAVDKLMVVLIHFQNGGAVLIANYTYESYLESESTLLARDRYKYGEFEKIVQIRKELGQELADRYLKE
jgi:5'-deoxynucleotidase YfbR-like HD superfamily hydrolase